VSPADLERLEACVLGLLGEGAPVRLDDLRRDFPEVEESDIRRVQTSAEILGSWLQDLGGGKHHESSESWLAPGDRIGGYVVLRRIPGGAMGQVYHAVQESLYPRRVALKVHRVGADADRELRRARREAEVASRLIHPHLAAIHDMGHDVERGLVYFSMQLVEGCDLREALSASDPLGVRRLVTRLSEVAGALAELHARGYVHRDVKPENVLLRANAGRDGRSESAVLVDFGLVRAERALRGDAVLPAGTPGYAPPEADLPGGVTPAWDVYSLGVILYEALRGEPPPLDARGRLRRPSADDLHALRADADLRAIVAHATRAEPRARYRDAGELQADLERWLAGEEVSVRRPLPHERAWRAVRRRPRRAAIALLSIPLLLAAVFLAGRVAGEVDDVRGGLAALEDGEPARGWEQLAAANPLFVRWLVRGRPDLERDLLHGTRESPLTVVGRAELERGRGAALELAAAYLERDGFTTGGVPTHPELEAFLLRSLDSGRAEERAQALRTVARLFFERPIDTPESVSWAAPFRERLLSIPADAGSGRDDRLQAITALGGCGTPEELGALLACAEDAMGGGDVEGERLAVYACCRILRRCGTTATVDALDHGEWAALEQRFAALWRDVRAWIGTAQGTQISWMDLTVAWGLAHRLTGYRLRLLDEFEAGLESTALLAHAALRGPDDDALQERLLATAGRRTRLKPAPWERAAWAYDLGIACAYVGPDELLAGIETRLADDPELLEHFALGAEQGTFDVEHGVASEHLPDELSRLRHLLGSHPSDEPVDLEPGARLPEGTVALWRFRPRERAGWATTARTGAGGRWVVEEHDPPHLRLARSGAWLETRFVIGDAILPPADGWNLVLTHVAASRPYLPLHGQAWIRVELDGAELTSRHRVGFVGEHELALLIERDLLTPGEHVVRVTVVEASTTYWVREVRMERW
jgi:tRNA A-37 threonylcarbamoyl transferase component Bud32